MDGTVWDNGLQKDVRIWVRAATVDDCTRRSKFFEGKRISNDPEQCSHEWLRYSGFDECRHCGIVA